MTTMRVLTGFFEMVVLIDGFSTQFGKQDELSVPGWTNTIASDPTEPSLE